MYFAIILFGNVVVLLPIGIDMTILPKAIFFSETEKIIPAEFESSTSGTKLLIIISTS
jgi:hypothetical protein